MCPGRLEQPTTVTPESMRTVVEANVIGVIRVTSTMLSLLHRSAHPRIVNQSNPAAEMLTTSQATPKT